MQKLSQELSGLMPEILLDFHCQLVYAALGMSQLLLKMGAVQGRSHHFKSGGDGMSSVIPVFSVKPCLIDRFYF